MNWKGFIGLLLAALLLFSAGCTSPAAKNGTQTAVTDTPTLPGEYSAREAATAGPPLTNPTVTVNATPPTLSAYQLSTIPTSNLTGGTSSVNTSTTSGGIIAPVASFGATNTAGFAPLTVQFVDTSLNQPTSWSWDFGDGKTSDLQNPPHTYTGGGQFNVSFSATNIAGTGSVSSINFISVYAPGFSGSPTTGNHPLSVLFNDTGIGYPSPSSWFWDFGDIGPGNTSKLTNPTHQYINPGIYSVSHSATNSIGTIWVNKTGYITVS